MRLGKTTESYDAIVIGAGRAPAHLLPPELDGISEADRVTQVDYFAHVPQEISVPCLHQPDHSK
jgi:hypothetical protein